MTVVDPTGPVVTPWLRDELPDLSEPGEDAFAVRDLVTGLAELVREAQPPFVVSISGAWGVGKSTVAENIRRILEGEGGLVAYIDAWTTDLENLRRTLIIEAGAALRGQPPERRGPDREAIALSIDVAMRTETTRTESGVRQAPIQNVLSALARTPFLWILAGIGAFLLFVLATSDPSKPVPLAAFFGTMAAALFGFVLLGSGLLVHSVSVATRRAAARESVAYADVFDAIVTGREAEKAREQGRLGRPLRRIMRSIRAALRRPAPTAQTALVIVDNLDRLASEDALQALSQIRSFVELPESRCLFLIPVDRRALTRHLAAALDERNEGAAADYLSKFFNLDLVLTDPEPSDLRDWAVLQLSRSLMVDRETAATTAQIVVSAAGPSPRTIRRIISGVATRWRLLERGSRREIDVPTIAFVEGLMVAFPNVLPGLIDDPRQFISAFGDLRLTDELGDERLTGLFTPPLGERDGEVLRRFRAYLTRNQTLELSQTSLRLALSLRENRVWKRVGDPAPLLEALDAALDGTAFRAAWANVPQGEQRYVRSALIDVLRSDLGYPQDAIAHLNAVAAIIDADGATIQELRGLSNLLDTLRRANDQEFALLTPGSAGLIGTIWRGDRRLPLVADRAPAMLEAAKTRGAGLEESFHVVVALADSMSPTGSEAARKLVVSLPDDLVAELFEPFRGVLAEGPVIEGLLGRLATWTSAGDHERAATAVELLARAAAARWQDPERITVLVAVVEAQAAAAATDPDSRPIVLGMLNLLRHGQPGPEIDHLSSVLATTPPAPDPAEFLLAVLALPIQEATRNTIPGALDRWISGAALADVQALVIDGRGQLNEFGYDARVAVLERWAAGGGVQWAMTAAKASEPPNAQPVVARLAASTAVPHFARLVTESTTVVEEVDSTSASDVIAAFSPALAGMALPDIESVTPSLVTLQRLGADTVGLVTALEARAAVDPALGPFATVVRKLDDAGFGGLGRVALPLARRGAAAGGIELDDVSWIVRATNGTNEARRAVTRLVESEPVDRLEPVLPTLRALRGHPDVRLAAAQRAPGLGSADEAGRLLGAVRGYQSPTQPEYQQAIDQVGRQWPELTDFLLEIA